MRPPRPRLNLRVATLAVTAFVSLACAAPQARSADVQIENYRFAPAEVTVKVGEPVVWTNAEKRVSHSVLFTGPGGLESERMFPGERWERRFDKPGRYPYTCGPHPEMKGVVIVTP